MARPITLFTGQWADLPLERLCELVAGWGYDGLELACWGDHFDVPAALADPVYCARTRELLERHGLRCEAISAHLVGQATCDRIDDRHRAILPPEIWGDDEPAGVRRRAAERVQDTARAAAQFGVERVNGFTGSGIWHLLYSFPPNDWDAVARGYDEFADCWQPILDVFSSEGVRFGLEVHPGEIAYDIPTAAAALSAVDGHASFGFNLDPSHLVHQFVDPAEFAAAFPERLFHVHLKDAKRRLNGRRSILGSHLPFGDERRGWDFVSLGHGDVDFGEFIRSLNRAGYDGPLSIEWEDSGMDREWGARDALAFARSVNFAPADAAFDDAFRSEP